MMVKTTSEKMTGIIPTIVTAGVTLNLADMVLGEKKRSSKKKMRSVF